MDKAEILHKEKENDIRSLVQNEIVEGYAVETSSSSDMDKGEKWKE